MTDTSFYLGLEVNLQAKILLARSPDFATCETVDLFRRSHSLIYLSGFSSYQIGRYPFVESGLIHLVYRPIVD